MSLDQKENPQRLTRIILLVLVLYPLLFAFSYLFDPLARSPQLDARENLVLAQQFDEGTIAAEPFYRAVLYPFALSQLHPVEARPALGLLFGMALHLLVGWLVYRIAWIVWKKPLPALLSAALYLLNPASLFFSVQLLDVTLATALFLGGLLMGLREPLQKRNLLLCGALLGLAVVTRPHFLLVAALVPLAIAFMGRTRSQKPLLAWGSIAVILLLQGVINYRQSGDFRILPWQGAFNLWAANKPEANGLYFKQSVDVSVRENNENPAKVESLYLYGIAHPDQQAPYPIEDMNAYWRTRFIDRVMENPLQVVRLWSFKAYAVANSFEQYNNMTFSFHKKRLPLLRFNPLNWGIVFVFAIPGFLQLVRTRPRTALAWLAIIGAYAAMLIAFYASARFRIPLVPLMVVLAGGSIGWFQGLTKDRPRLVATIAALVLGTGLAYSSFADIRNPETMVQDRLLMANANADLDRDAEAAKWARQVLVEDSTRREAQRIYAISYFNMALSEDPARMSFGNWNDQSQWVVLASTQDPVQATIQAFYAWHWGNKDQAMRIWTMVGQSAPERGKLARLAISVVEGASETNALSDEQRHIQRILMEH